MESRSDSGEGESLVSRGIGGDSLSLEHKRAEGSVILLPSASPSP